MLTRNSYTNDLNTNLVRNIKDIGKVPIHVRLGGSSQNVARWNESLEQGLSVEWTGDKAARVWMGPKVVEGFDVWPEDTKYTFGLPFNFSTYENLIETDLKVAPVVADHLGDKLDMFEVGNEFGHDFKGGPAHYVSLWLDYARNISDTIWGVKDHPGFLVGSFQEPECSYDEDPDCYDVKGILELGIAESGLAETANTHMYMGSAGDEWSTHQFLMSHNNTAKHVAIHDELASYTTGLGLPYVLGETNSLSGHGKEGVSDSFAAALWTIDYIMTCAQSNISRVFLHQGNGWKYSAWTPYDQFGYPGGVKGSYYSYLFTAAAFAGEEKQVEVLYAEDHLVAYGIYTGSCSKDRHRRGELESIVSVNLEAWQESKASSDRPRVAIEIPRSLQKAKVQRLTALGADSLEDIVFRGQFVDKHGNLRGRPEYETVKKNRVHVYASEAVLIRL